MSSKKKTNKENITESQEEPQIVTEAQDVVEKQIVEKQQPVVNTTKKQPLLNKEERMYVYKMISNGYTLRDIIKRSKIILKLSDEKYEKMIKNVKVVDDLIKNILGEER